MGTQGVMKASRTGVQTAGVDAINRGSGAIDFGLCLKIKAVEGMLKSYLGGKWTDLAMVRYGPDQISGWREHTEINAA